MIGYCSSPSRSVCRPDKHAIRLERISLESCGASLLRASAHRSARSRIFNSPTLKSRLASVARSLRRCGKNLGRTFAKSFRIKTLTKSDCIVFEPAQGFGPVLVKRVVAARGSVIAATPALRGPLHPLHAALHSVHASLPTVRAVVFPACHPPTPHQEPENQEAQRPEQDEADNRQRDPGRLADVVQLRRERLNGGTLC